MKIPELLAPAGDMESLEAAVIAGADAIYLGGELFNARINASNFSNDELKKALEFCHLYGRKMYITVNTMLFNEEFNKFIKYIEYIYKIGVDGVIVQDIGAIMSITLLFPKLPVHVSTQATILNSEAQKLLEDNGINRVVLGRELSLKEIESVHKNTNSEIEIFLHGALCVCYSGKCLMSSIIGGRSGNRGLCAQPCRLNYKLIDSEDNEICKGHLLSTKDMCTIEDLPQIVQSGVASLKIEGRMKRPQYVYNVVRIYRKYLDMIKHNPEGDYKVSKEDYDNLLLSFNRGGFSKGYLFGKQIKEMMCTDKPDNRGLLIGNVLNITKTNENKIFIAIKLSNKLSRLDGIEFTDKNGKSCGGKIVDVLYSNRRQRIEFGMPNQEVTVEIENIKNPENASMVYKTFSVEMEKEWGRALNNDIKSGNLYIKFYAKVGEKAALEMSDGINCAKAYSDNPVEKALKVATSEDKIKEGLLKLGGTPFENGEVQINIGSDINLSASVINKMRRSCIEIIEAKRSKGNTESQSEIKEEKINYKLLTQKLLAASSGSKEHDRKIAVDVYSQEQFNEIINLPVDVINYNFEDFIKDRKNSDSIIDLCNEKNIQLVFKIPHIFRQDNLPVMKKYLDTIKSFNMAGKSCGVLINDIAVLNYVKNNNIDVNVYGDYGLNISNSYSCVFYKELGMAGATMSSELDLYNIRTIQNTVDDSFFDKYYLVHGFIQFMISEYCAIRYAYEKDGNSKLSGSSRCGMCEKGKEYFLLDRIGKKNKIVTNSLCQSMIYNDDILYMGDRLEEVKKSGINSIRIDGRFLLPGELKDVLDEYINKFKYNSASTNNGARLVKYTRGCYYRK